MRIITWLSMLAAALVLVTCGLGGGGKPVPTLSSDFAPGSTIPGWVLSPPAGGRAEVASSAIHENGRWTVILSRALRSVPRDVPFSIAVANDGLSHSGSTNVRWTADPSATGSATTLVARRVANGSIAPDGVASPSEWSAVGSSSIPMVARNNLPTGKWPTANNTNLFAQSAYDDEFVYFSFRWTDPAPPRSEFGPVLQWDGTNWVRKPHRTNDTNGDGILGPSEPMTISASAEDEDRLFLFWPIHDSVRAYRPGGSGCAVSCHQNEPLDAMGFEAVHAWVNPDDRTDVWQWRASATAPARRLDDNVLRQGNPALGKSGGGSGFASDAGVAPFGVSSDTNPTAMFAAPVGGFARLISEPLTFDSGIPAGYPVLAPLAANTASFNFANFNATGLAPPAWATPAPNFANNFLPAYFHRQPTESRADLEAGTSFSGTQWVVEIRRKRVTRDTAGRPREDDVQFDEDVDLFSDAFLSNLGGPGATFSVSITDGARGHGVRETQYAGPLRLTRDPTLVGPSLGSGVFLHDYGSGFLPASAADFTDPRTSTPTPSFGADNALLIKAGTDGGERLFVLASWLDANPDLRRDEWEWTGFNWSRSGDDDELRWLWGSESTSPGFGSTGCGVYCHQTGGIGAPSELHFSARNFGETADLWYWRASLTQSLGFADDLTVGSRFYDLIATASGRASLAADGPGSIFTENAESGRDFPRFMSASDPGASAAFLTMGVATSPDAIPFVDALGNLPPPPPPPGSPISFAAQIRPILNEWCTACHPSSEGLSLLSWNALIAGSQNGPVVLPGNSAMSPIIQRLQGTVMPRMPLGGAPLATEQIQLIAQWIDQGALNN